MDISVAFNNYKFLGEEFLTWLWYAIHEESSLINDVMDKERHVELLLGNSLSLEKDTPGNGREKISIKGEEAGLNETLLAISNGAMVTQISLILKIGDTEFSCSLKGEDLSLNSLKCKTEAPKSDEDIDGAVLEKVYLHGLVFDCLDALFGYYIKARLSGDWDKSILPTMKSWITKQKSGDDFF
jgi:hypothetical protein